MFQILANSPSRKAVLTWPIEGCDAKEFGKLALDVRIDSPAQSVNASPASSSSIASGSLGPSPQTATTYQVRQYQHRQQNDPDSPYAEVRTSCTRRYRSRQSFSSNSMLHEVESIFIPHGSVIFACHQVINRYHMVPSFDTLAASSSAAPAFRPQSQQWTLTPKPLALHSLSTDNVHQAKRYPPPQSSLSSDFPNFSPSRMTPPSAASTLSSGCPISPASSDNREWHDWHQNTSFGFSAGVHNHLPKSEPVFHLAYPAVSVSFVSWNLNKKGGRGSGIVVCSGKATVLTKPEIDTHLQCADQTQELPWPDHTHPPSAYPVDVGSWTQSASTASYSPPARGQVYFPLLPTGQGSPNAPSSTPRKPSGNRVHALPPLNTITANVGGIVPPPDGNSSTQQPRHVSSFVLPPPSQLFPSYGSIPPPPSDGLSKAGGSPSFDYGSGNGFGWLAAQEATVSATAHAPHQGRPHGITSYPLDVVSPATNSLVTVTGSTGGTGAGGRLGGKRGGVSSGLVNGGRVSGNPPAGVTRCAFCGTTTSPEWRKGVTGIKNLCNA